MFCSNRGIGGYLNIRDLADSVRNDNVQGIQLSTSNDKFDCKICICEKMTASTKESELLEIVHSDVCEPMRVESNGKIKFFVTFDDHSR